MRYGTIPLVRETGGLKDTVKPYNKFTGEGTGFTFKRFDAWDLKDAMFRAIDVYNNNKEAWKSLIYEGMEKDYSWNSSALVYINLFNKLI